MRLDIRGLNIDLTTSILEHVRHRLFAALGALAPRVESVHVRVSDLNAGRGGVDKHCHLDVRVDGVGAVVIEQTDHDLYAAACAGAKPAIKSPAVPSNANRAIWSVR